MEMGALTFCNYRYLFLWLDFSGKRQLSTQGDHCDQWSQAKKKALYKKTQVPPPEVMTPSGSPGFLSTARTGGSGLSRWQLSYLKKEDHIMQPGQVRKADFTLCRHEWWWTTEFRHTKWEPSLQNFLFSWNAFCSLLWAENDTRRTHLCSHTWKQERKEQIKIFLVVVLSRAFSENCIGHSEVTHLLVIA